MQWMCCECSDDGERKESDHERSECYSEDDRRHVNVTTITNVDRWWMQWRDFMFVKKCEISMSELRLLKADKTQGNYLEVWASVVESPWKKREEKYVEVWAPMVKSLQEERNNS